MSAFTEAEASLLAMLTKTGPAGMVSNSGAIGFAGSAGFPSASFFNMSAAVPKLESADWPSGGGVMGFSFFSSGFRPRAIFRTFLSKVSILKRRSVALAATAFASVRSFVSEKRILESELSTAEILSALSFWPSGVFSAVQGASFVARETVREVGSLAFAATKGISILATSSTLRARSSVLAQFLESVSR